MLTRHHKDKIDRWIEAIEASGKGLTPWEDQFVEDMKGLLSRYGTISQKQEEVIKRIYAEKTP